MRSAAERIGSDDELFRLFKDAVLGSFMVAMPGIIQSFNADEQTVEVQLTIKENFQDNDGSTLEYPFPLLIDVPIVLPSTSAFMLTLPIKKGDECLVVFADMCIDGWWKSGGVQSQLDNRRHDLSDAFAILGCWSQPNLILNYNMNNAQLRNKAGTTFVEITPDGKVNINANNIELKGEVAITGDLTLNGKHLTFQETTYQNHTHMVGSQTSTGPTPSI